jgi:hypothetical protein
VAALAAAAARNCALKGTGEKMSGTPMKLGQTVSPRRRLAPVI